VRRAAPDGSGPADSWPAAVNDLPALRLTGHPADRPVQRHGLQVAAPLHRVRRALRSGQADMNESIVTESTGSQRPASRRPRSRDFHRLTVRRVEPLTGDSAAITFTVPADLAEDFAFAAGQTLTIRRGEDRRSYSI